MITPLYTVFGRNEVELWSKDFEESKPRVQGLY